MAKKSKVSRRWLSRLIKCVLAEEDAKGAKANRIARGVIKGTTRGSVDRAGGRKRRKGHGPANPPKIDIPAI